jgi:hypothetical protein
MGIYVVRPYIRLRELVACKLVLLLAIASCFVNADEVYKWKDAVGKIHYGDRKSAPSESQKLDIQVSPSSASNDEQSTRKKIEDKQARIPAVSAPGLESKKKSVPVESYRVGPRCKGLIDQIAKVKRGENWESLSNDFERACPGIAYECNNYRTHPENNSCTWVERTGNSVLHTNEYP